MPNVRKGLLNQKKKAKTLSELQEAVNELGLLVVKLAQALGMMGEV